MIRFSLICSRSYAPGGVDIGRRSWPQQFAQICAERVELCTHVGHSDAIDDDTVELGNTAAALDQDTR